MGKIILVIKTILKRMFKKPSSFFLYLILPIAVSIGMYLLFNLEDHDKTNITVVDADQTMLSRSLIGNFEGTDGFDISHVHLSYLHQHMMDTGTSLAYIIPSGFEKAILAGEKPALEILSVGDQDTIWLDEILSAHVDTLMMMAEASNFQKKQLYENIYQLKDGRVNYESALIQDEAKKKSVTVRTFGNYMVVLLISTFTIPFQILNEKRQGTFARIGMSPIHPKSYIFANIIANVLVMMVQVGVVLLTLKFILGAVFFVNPFIIYLILILFALCGISLGVFIAAYSKNTNAAGAFMGIIVSPSCMIAGCLWPIEFMPEYMQKIAYITPHRWTLDAISTIQANQNIVEILPHLLVVLSFTLLFFLIAVYKFKHEDKLYA